MTAPAFLTELHLGLVADDGPRPLFTLDEPFSYASDVAGMTVTVPSGFETDGASIPQLAMSFTGYPGMRAAVVHDFLVHQPAMMDREMADRVFREALAVCGVDHWTADLMYSGVAGYTESLKPKDDATEGGA
jgi:hypothetical protein